MSASTLPADADKPFLESRHPRTLMVAVMAISLCQFLDVTIANVALPHMQTSLGASADTISWVLTSFIIAGVLMLPLTGWLSDRIGSRNLFIGASVLFVLASMLCGAATSLTQMMVFRAIQGASSSMIGPLSQTIMFDLNRPSRQHHAMSIWGMVVMLGPISGPFLGGYLTEYLNWRWVFYVNLPIGIPAIIVLWWLLPSRPRVRRQLDIFGAVALGTGLVALQLLLDRGQHKDWFESTEIVIEAVIAISALWIFAVHSWGHRHPLFRGEMVWNPNFLGGVAFTTILGLSNVALSAVLPSMYQNLYGFDVLETGILMAPRGVGILITMMICNRLMTRVDNRLLISGGFAITAYSLWLMTTWSLEMNRDLIILSGFVQGLGMGFVFAPINILAFSTLAPHFRTEGTTLMTLFRNLGGSFGIAVMVTMLARNMQASHADVGANLTSYNLPAVDPAATAGQLGVWGDAAMVALNAEVTRQAAMIAYLDSFYMMLWTVVAFVPLVWLLKRPRPATMPHPVELD